MQEQVLSSDETLQWSALTASNWKPDTTRGECADHPSSERLGSIRIRVVASENEAQFERERTHLKWRNANLLSNIFPVQELSSLLKEFWSKR